MEFIKDILLTEQFMVKCFIETGRIRLSDYLDSLKRDFIPVNNVTMIDVQEGEIISSNEALIRRDEIILAHELLDVSGDANMKGMVDEAAFSRLVDLYHTGSLGLEISGMIRPEAYEGIEVHKNFFVMRDPKIAGLNLKVSPEFKLISSLSYVIINRKQIGYIFNNRSK